MEKKRKPVILVILDGWGYREETANNPIAEADTPFFDSLWQEYPHGTLGASGLDVGMPEGQIGNSEVCHMTIGAGRAIDTDLVRINKSIADGSYAKNAAFEKLFAHVAKHGSALHVFGLVSPGGVHSHQEHLFAFLQAAQAAGIGSVAIHAIADGRDVLPQSANEYLKQLEDFLAEKKVGRIASVCGRYWAMDRDRNWNRTEVFDNLLFKGEGKALPILPPSAGISMLHKDGTVKLDELTEAYAIPDGNGQPTVIRENDGVFFFNFRSDRARQESAKIDARVEEMNLCFVTMADYGDFPHALVAFPPISITTTLAGEISRAGLSQAHIAETEKFAHATYYLNGGRESHYPGETQILIESRKDVKTHDEAPEMKAKEIADAALAEISHGTDFIFINFANADMVGHIGNQAATRQAVECLDRELKRVTERALEAGGAVIVSADHGNAEYGTDPETGSAHTAHTTSRVPVIVTVPGRRLAEGKTIASLAATALEILGLPKPDGMEPSLLD